MRVTPLLHGGKLMVETTNVELDGDYVAIHSHGAGRRICASRHFRLRRRPQGVFDINRRFLQKPFTLKAMANKVREILAPGRGACRDFRLINLKSAPLPYNDARTLHGTFPGANSQPCRIFFP